jgi:two-component system, sensor histidine kinase and response regulator
MAVSTIDKKLESPGTEQSVLNILLVDDKEDNLISLESILDDPKRNLIKAQSGNEALKIAFERDIAVILLDVQMPEMDGFEVARILKQNPKTKDIAVIFVTAISKEEKYTLQGYEEGAVDYLHKPLEVNIVKAKVSVFEKLYRSKMELKMYVEKTQQINRQLDEFVYIVSHDLKAPLRGLSSVTSFLEDELGTDLKPEVRDLLEMVKSRTSRMQSLIDGILHYSRMANNRTEKETVKLMDVITNIIDLLSVPGHVRIQYPDNLPVLFDEKIKLHEVFQNLISNAIKYNDKEHAEVKISYTDKGQHFEFSIEDNGIGIKPEHYEKIFGVFQTLKSKDKQESTGIGLTIVKKIIEQQGGKVWVESEYGKRTKFIFTWNK